MLSYETVMLSTHSQLLNKSLIFIKFVINIMPLPPQISELQSLTTTQSKIRSKQITTEHNFINYSYSSMFRYYGSSSDFTSYNYEGVLISP